MQTLFSRSMVAMFRRALVIFLSPFVAAHGQLIGSVAADRARIAELLGEAPSTATAQTNPSLWQVVGPDVRLVWNSALPYSLNDGPLWAGRGANVSVMSGVALDFQRARYGVTIIIAPTFMASENLPFDIVPGREPGRSVYSSPWHLDGASADLPLRFGDQPLRSVDAGESTVAVRFWNVSAGAANSAEWWGPGIRNALVMSNNAGGIPRAFVRSAEPLRTPIGRFTGELEVGTLTKSLFFDALPSSDYRSFSGLLVTYRPGADSNLTVGLAHTTYAPMTSWSPPLSAVLNAVRTKPSTGGGDPQQADQIASLFVRWVLPESGFEVYGEWARMDLPESLAEVLETPYNSEGFTLGLQWAIPTNHAGRLFRIQSEVTDLDQNAVASQPSPVDFYTGRVAPQGYTERGQIIGAAIGPGGSSQWFALDEVAPSWQFGGFVGRTRWEDNALYRQQFSTDFSHDVSVFAGLRGGVRLPAFDLETELTVAKRFNYLFQNGSSNPLGQGTVNIRNVTATVRLTPR